MKSNKLVYWILGITIISIFALSISIEYFKVIAEMEESEVETLIVEKTRENAYLFLSPVIKYNMPIEEYNRFVENNLARGKIVQLNINGLEDPFKVMAVISLTPDDAVVNGALFYKNQLVGIYSIIISPALSNSYADYELFTLYKNSIINAVGYTPRLSEGIDSQTGLIHKTWTWYRDEDNRAFFRARYFKDMLLMNKAQYNTKYQKEIEVMGNHLFKIALTQ